MALPPRIREALDRLRAAHQHDAFEHWSPAGLLLGHEVERRDCNVPPEAFRVLHSHADGVHYALWIDDAAADLEPPVVTVSPMDAQTIRLVAASVDELLAVVETAGAWLVDDEEAAAAAKVRAQLARRSAISIATDDRMGVVCSPEPTSAMPDRERLLEWLDEPSRARVALAQLCRAGSPGHALSVARDLIARGAGDRRELAEAFAEVYRALGRALHADVMLAKVNGL